MAVLAALYVSYANAAAPRTEAAQKRTEGLPAELVTIDVFEGDVKTDKKFSEVVKRGYELASNDVLDVRVYNEKELSGSFQVDALGKILLPLIGSVDVMGLTPYAVAQELEAKLKDGYLVRPSVSVEIKKFRPFYLLGEVQVPGHYNYSYGLNVMKAVAIGGGFTYRANQKKFIIQRDFNGVKEKVEVDASTVIFPGDIITVKERFF